MDVFGFAKSDLFVVFSILIIRQGKMMGVKNYHFENVSIDDEQMLISFLTQYYSLNKLLPEKILLPFEIDLDDALFKALSEQLGEKIEVSVPTKSTNKQLITQANNNANEYLTKSCEVEKGT